MTNINTFDNKSVRRINDSVRYTQAQTKTQGKSPLQAPKVYKARLTVDIDGTKFEAEQVYYDGTNWQTVTDGVTWDTTTPLHVKTGGAVDDVLSAEPLNDGANSTIWVALKTEGGGGSASFRLKVKATVTVDPLTTFLCDIIDNAGGVLTSNVNVRQKKFASAKFYINEIIYGDENGLEYLADAYLAGIGVG